MTVHFDNSGEELGITTSGATEFSFKDSNWSGGIIGFEGRSGLYASGSRSYLITDGAEVTFDVPIDFVEFFYVDDFEYDPGTATAFDADGNELSSIESNMATTRNNESNYVTLDPETPIARLTISSGVVDAFSFTTLGDPPPPVPEGAVTTTFDGEGDEAGITVPAAVEFSLLGSNWSGGVVGTEGIAELYASGDFSYEVDTKLAVVQFDAPVDIVHFFYVHDNGGRFGPGVATAFDVDGNELGTADSNTATSFADPNNFVVLDHETPISRVTFSGGIIDNFNFPEIALPPPPPPEGSTTILFDGEGDEAGITTPGTTAFTVFGSTWSGGVVDTLETLPFYASGSISYEVVPGPAEVVFDPPVEFVHFFYVNGGPTGPGTTTAFDEEGNELGTAESNEATTFGDPFNFAVINPDVPIARVTFSDGILDNFSYIPALHVDFGPFLRGDCDGNGVVGGSPTEAIVLLNFSFRGGAAPGCLAACDAEANGSLGITDALRILRHAFLGIGKPDPPFPDCSFRDKQTDIDLGCEVPFCAQ